MALNVLRTEATVSGPLPDQKVLGVVGVCHVDRLLRVFVS